MKLKKIFVLVLSGVLILSSMLCANAEDTSLPYQDIEENSDVSVVSKNFMDVCAPYQISNLTDLQTGSKSFSMGGEQYRDGITMKVMETGSWFLSNLKGEYSELQFYLGHVDGSGMSNVTLSVYLDDVLYKSYEVLSMSLPELISIPVSGVAQIKAVATFDKFDGYATIGLGNMIVIPDSEQNTQEIEIIDEMSVNFMDVCAPYQKSNYTDLCTDTKTFSMGGDQYRDGITMQVMEPGAWFLSNLKGEYSEIQFYLGHVDGSGMSNVTLTVYLDDVFYDTYEVLSEGLPELISIPVSGVAQFKANAIFSKFDGYATIGLGNMVIK